MKRFMPHGNPLRILDLLETDCGWLTAAGIADRLGISDDTAERALYRLREHGFVQSRDVELAAVGGVTVDGRNKYRVETRREWSV